MGGRMDPRTYLPSSFFVRNSPTAQSQWDIVEHLQDTFRFMARSSTAFDQGDFAEAKRLAVGIRLLVHDTPHSVSLLTQLGSKGGPFRDTMVRWHEVPGAHEALFRSDFGLARIQLTERGAFIVAPLDDLAPERDGVGAMFDEWWNREIFHSVKATRKSLVLAVANKDGGAHVDPKLEEAYASLTRYNSGSHFFEHRGISRPIGRELVFVSIRQIWHEILTSIAISADKPVQLRLWE
jgi:hypothetical protein